MFGSWTYTEAGVYVYEVSEIAGSSNNCSYDKTVYTVTDTVTDNDGVLTVSRDITDGDGKSADEAVFVNTYDDDVPTDEEDSSEADSSSRPEKDDDSSRGVETPEDSSSNSESSSSESSSSKSDSSETSSAGGSTVQSNSNPNTGVKSLVGIQVVMLGALLCVMKKKKEDK